MQAAAKNTALALATLLVCVVVGEVFLRIVWDNPYKDSEADRVVLIRVPHAGIDLPIDRSLIDDDLPDSRLRTNDRSYILPAFQYENPEFTVAFLGGSTTECSAVSEDSRFHALVSTYLSDRFRVNTLNGGRSGNTVHDSINSLLNHVVEDRPDFVVLMHATNDAGIIAFRGGYQDRMGKHVTPGLVVHWTGQLLSHFSLASILRNTTRWSKPTPIPAYTRLDGEVEEVMVVDAEQDEFRDRLNVFIAASRALDITPILMTQPASTLYQNALTPSWTNSSLQDAFNAVVREVGDSTGVEVIDLVEYLKSSVENWDEPDVVFYDAIHVNDNGSAAYARHISDRLALILAERKSSR